MSTFMQWQPGRGRFDEDGIWGPTVYSEYSEPRVVRLSSGCNNLSAGVDARVYAADRAIW